MHKKIIGCSLVLAVLISPAFTAMDGDALKLPKLFTTHYAFISSGASDQNVKQAEGFFMSKTEVDNIEYREFLSYIGLHQPELLPIAAIDTSAWIDLNMKPFAEFYHKHPAYSNYPVVNISYEAATLYCAWLTEFNQTKGLFAELEGYKVTYRLPTREEWMSAAEGKAKNAPYAWEGKRLRDKKGYFMANFQVVGEERLSFDPATKTYDVRQLPPDTVQFWDQKVFGSADITAPARSHSPNDLGIYNMNGNVAEMLAEPGLAAGGSWLHTGFDIRNESLMKFEGPSPMVGFRTVAVVEKL